MKAVRRHVQGQILSHILNQVDVKVAEKVEAWKAKIQIPPSRSAELS